MYRPDDKDIDRLSREAAEHYQAPGSPAWDTLRKTLEKELPQEKEKKRRGFLFFFLLFAGLSLTGSTIWYNVHKNNPSTINDKTALDKQNGLKANTATKPTAPEVMADAKKAGLPADKKSANQSNSKTKNTSGQETAIASAGPDHAGTKITGKIANTLPLVKSTGKQNTGKADDPRSGISLASHTGRTHLVRPEIAKTQNLDLKTSHHATSNDIAVQRKTVKAKHSRKNTKQVPDEANLPGTENPDNNKETNTVNNNDKAGDHSLAIPPAPDSLNSHETAKDLPVTKPVIPITNPDSNKTATAKSKNPSKKDKAILLGLTGGFDFSTVKFTHGSNAGYNIGLMGGYQFNKHWAVLTGLIYTKKNYILNGKDYNPPKHDWTYYVDLQKVDGFCRMWELPVEARYTFNPGAKNVFFANAGLSSYFMKKQQYDYYYKNGMGVSMIAPWHNDSSFTHVFSILDLSIGLQKPVGKHMDLLIEPYAKIPLGGVGFGNIRLSSFGVNLTVQYKKPLKR
jgi:hypothetical protein